MKSSRKTDRHFWLKLYFKDWHNSQEMMLCSMQARGVAIEAEMIMKQSPHAGFLLTSKGEPINAKLFARMAQGDESEIQAGLDELVERGEFDFTGGVYYCKRVALAMQQSDQNSENAKNRWGRNAGRNANRKKSAMRSSDSDSDSDSPSGEDVEMIDAEGSRVIDSEVEE